MGSLIPVVLIAVVVGVFIGAVGVGGVALPPFLMWFLDVDAQVAAGTSSLSFLLTGTVGTLLYARQGTIPWKFVAILSAGIAPAALLGSYASRYVPKEAALLPLALLVLTSGILNLRTPRNQAMARETLNTGTTLLVGCGVGFFSALTGTGGPVILIPVLMFFRLPPLTSVAAAQAIQVPLVVFAATGYAQQGAVEYGTALIIGVIACFGVWLGAAIALRMPQHALKRIAGSSLLGFGALLLGTTMFSVVSKVS